MCHIPLGGEEAHTHENKTEDRELNFCETPRVPNLKSWGSFPPHYDLLTLIIPTLTL